MRNYKNCPFCLRVESPKLTRSCLILLYSKFLRF
nr:MAG TPA: restriction alleviation protein [Caudoviricetes sp.]DAR58083.1 MAG TPA: restriction alleviation protein [Caudoviricetes sp.]DAX98101.1 MAG TPA: restriction alleviation protein [Caudoviricetes sp.]